MIVKFMDGKESTTQELAELIRVEGRLGVQKYSTQQEDGSFLRCPMGVIEDWVCSGNHYMTLHSYGQLFNKINTTFQSTNGLFELNDRYIGTPEERAIYIANILDTL